MSHLRELRAVLGARPLFSVGAGVCLLDDRGRLLLQQRSDSGLWGIPGGSAEPGESLLDTVRRELREETGIELPPERFERLGVISGPEFHHRYPNGHEVYFVGAVYLARLAPPAALPAHADHETLALSFFELDALPDPLSGPIELAAVRWLRERQGLPLSPAPRVLRAPPPAGAGYLRTLRAALGSRPVFSVGAAVLVLDGQGRVLLREHGGGWGVPGSPGELGERFEDMARRALHEEAGLDAAQLEFLDLLTGPAFAWRDPPGQVAHHVSALFLTRLREVRPASFFAVDALPGEIAGPVSREALRRAAAGPSGRRGLAFQKT